MNRTEEVLKELEAFGNSVHNSYNSRADLIGRVLENGIGKSYHKSFSPRDIKQFREYDKEMPVVVLLDKSVKTYLHGVDIRRNFYDLIMQVSIRGIMSEGGLNETQISFTAKGELNSIYYGSKSMNQGEGEGEGEDIDDSYDSDFLLDLKHFVESEDVDSQMAREQFEFKIKLPENKDLNSIGVTSFRSRTNTGKLYITDSREVYEIVKQRLAKEYRDTSIQEMVEHNKSSKQYIFNKINEGDKTIVKYAEKVNNTVEELVPILASKGLRVQGEEILTVNNTNIKVYSITSKDNLKQLIILPNKVDLYVYGEGRQTVKRYDLYNRINKSFSKNESSIKRYSKFLNFTDDVHMGTIVTRLLNSTKLR